MVVGVDLIEVVAPQATPDLPILAGFYGYFFGDAIGDNEKRVMVGEWNGSGVFQSTVADFSLAGGIDPWRGGIILPNAQFCSIGNQHATHTPDVVAKVIDPWNSVEVTVNLTDDDGPGPGGGFQSSMPIVHNGFIYYATFEHASAFAGVTIKLWKAALNFSSHGVVASLSPPNKVPPGGSTTDAAVQLDWINAVWIADGSFWWHTSETWLPGPETYHHTYELPLSGGGSRTDSSDWTAWGDSTSYSQKTGLVLPSNGLWYGYAGARPVHPEVIIWKALASDTQPATLWPNTGGFKLDEDDVSGTREVEWCTHVWEDPTDTLRCYCTHTQEGAGNPPTQKTGRVVTATAESPSGPSVVTIGVHPTFNAGWPIKLGPKRDLS